MTGERLGGRYRLLERIGGGGMAVVYRALDTVLNRHVAVKILRSQYVHDEEFIQRFRREARSAASLSHPNVVSVYDVGQDGDTHYIVMEYVEGKTLNELIRERAPLSPEEAVRIAVQICDALDHAHANGIIHRDIKPHNILISKGGWVKVTDFGIARAADASQLTHTGTVVGSVHYVSPEYAKGLPAGAQSDLYSLGIVLYQMLTGKLPFNGESPISVALKHVQESFEEPRKLNPAIPQSLENVVLKATRKNRNERYQTAAEMMEDLETCLSPARRNEPKRLFLEEDDEQTKVMPAVRSGRDRAVDPSGAGGQAESGETPRRRRWVRPTIGIAFVLAVLVGTWFGVQYVLGMLNPEEVMVPNVVGKRVDVAEREIRDAKLVPEIIREEPPEGSDVPADVVFKQDPVDIRKVVGSSVVLYVSAGKQAPRMPGFVGMKYDDVIRTQLDRLGIPENRVRKMEVASDQPAGVVVAQDPAEGAEFDPASVELTLSVSKGPDKVPMPDLRGYTPDEAKRILRENRLERSVLKVEEMPSLDEKGRIFKQFPYNPGDPVAPGETITVFVSSGLPDDVVEGTVNLQVFPVKEGVESAVRIQIMDARHAEWFTWSDERISEAKVYRVPVTVTRDRAAAIQVYVDDKRVSYITRSYADLRPESSGAPQSPSAGGTGASDQAKAGSSLPSASPDRQEGGRD